MNNMNTDNLPLVKDSYITVVGEWSEVMRFVDDATPKKWLIMENKHKFTRDELIEEVKDDTDIGRTMIEMEMYYLRKLKEM